MRVFVAGAASWDTVIHLDRLPTGPSTVFAERSGDQVGSTGAGKALAFAALGHDVHLHTVLGTDAAGAAVTSELLAAGIHLHVDRDAGPTERHVNLMTPDGARTSIFRSIAAPAGPIDVDGLVALAEASDVVMLNITDYVRVLVPPLVARGIPFWTDLHDWDSRDPYHLDFLAASGIVVSDERLGEAASDMCAELAASGRTVVCTHGAAGATAWSDGEVLQVPADPVAEVIDTNGAGDAFTAGLLHGLGSGWTLRRALRAGAIAGAATVSSPTLAPAGLTAEALSERSQDPIAR